MPSTVYVDKVVKRQQPAFAAAGKTELERDVNAIYINTTTSSSQLVLPDATTLGADPIPVIHEAGDLGCELRPQPGQYINGLQDTPITTVVGARFLLVPQSGAQPGYWVV